MQVKDEDISTLIELQHNDMELLRDPEGHRRSSAAKDDCRCAQED